MPQFLLILLQMKIFVSLVETTVNFNECSRQENILDASGKLLTTTCILGTRITYDEAAKACKNYQMTLLKVKHEKTQSAIISKYGVLFEPEISFWINGRLEDDGNWYTFDTLTMLKNKLKRTEISFPNNTRSSEMKQELCLTLTGAMKMVGEDCAGKRWAFCEALNALLKVPPKSNICAIKNEVFIGDRYEKTICLAGLKMNSTEAEKVCAANNMSLLNLESPEFNKEISNQGFESSCC